MIKRISIILAKQFSSVSKFYPCPHIKHLKHFLPIGIGTFLNLKIRNWQQIIFHDMYRFITIPKNFGMSTTCVVNDTGYIIPILTQNLFQYRQNVLVGKANYPLGSSSFTLHHISQHLCTWIYIFWSVWGAYVSGYFPE